MEYTIAKVFYQQLVHDTLSLDLLPSYSNLLPCACIATSLVRQQHEEARKFYALFHAQSSGDPYAIFHVVFWHVFIFCAPRGQARSPWGQVRIPFENFTTISLVFSYIPHHLDLALEDSVGHSTCMSVLARRKAIMGWLVG